MNRIFLAVFALLSLFMLLTQSSRAENSEQIDLITACERLVRYYPIPRDNLDGSAYGNMFTSDGEFILRGVTTKGRENIAKQFLSRASKNTTRHVTGSINVFKVDETTATGISYAMVFQAQEGKGDKPHLIDGQSLLAVASYEDTFDFDGENCFFNQRKVNIDFLRGNSQ